MLAKPIIPEIMLAYLAQAYKRDLLKRRNKSSEGSLKKSKASDNKKCLHCVPPNRGSTSLDTSHPYIYNVMNKPNVKG